MIDGIWDGRRVAVFEAYVKYNGNLFGFKWFGQCGELVSVMVEYNMSLYGYELGGDKVVHPRVAFVNRKRCDESPELTIKDSEQPRQGDLRMIKMRNFDRLGMKGYGKDECSMRCYSMQEFIVNC